ncbi:tyrosine-type recombinase/integrase [Turicimonas sp. TL08]
MASIRKTWCGTYQVQWYEDKKRKSKNFKTRKEAKEFSLTIGIAPKDKASSITFGALLADYRDKETIKKRGARTETLRLNRLMTYPIAKVLLSDLTTKHFQKLVEERLASPAPTGGTISPATVIREFTSIAAALNYAVKKGFLEKNPAKGVELPKPPEHRERVASEEEQQAIIISSGWDGISPPVNTTQLVGLAFIFSCRTGMRSGEILSIEFSWIEDRVIHLPKEATKTASKRDVALSSDALRLLNLAIEAKQDKSAKIFGGVLNEHNRDVLFRKIRDRAGLSPVFDSEGRLLKEGLNFHDGRATFATWAASPDPKTGAPRLDVLALARQTGHKNLKMLQRYYRESAKNIAKRLD